MKAKQGCISCLFKQVLHATAEVTDDPDVAEAALRKLALHVEEVDLDQSPAALSGACYRIVSEVTGVEDPFLAHKEQSNALALRVLPRAREAVMSSPDVLAAALHLAATGNMIDAGVGQGVDEGIEEQILGMLDVPFGMFDLEAFRGELGPGKQLLYLGDNAGEIVLDTVLVDVIRETGTEVTYSVKSGPIINDATLADAEVAEMSARAKVIETGSNDIGLDFDHISDAFRQAYNTADAILGKGHGNFETCNERPENLYFLLKAKCELVAAELGVALGELVFKHSPRRHT